MKYKPTSPSVQGKAVTRWLIQEGNRRPSEAAMEVATMSKATLRRLYKDLVTLGKVTQ